MNKSQKVISAGSEDRENLLIQLKETQSKFGYLPREVMADLADSFGLSIGDVYGVATFYSFLSAEPLGRNVIRVCKSLPCHLKNSLIESVEQEIGINPGETTTDGRFSFQLTNCIGACDKAPAMMINHDIHGSLTPGEISRILKAYK